VDEKLRAALTRYRVMAYVVGVMLLVLLLVAMPLKYLADSEGVIGVVGPLHGFLYAVYLLATLSVGTKSLWSFRRTVGVMLAGTIPFLSFVAERRVTRDVQAQLARDLPG
jgi:integral membrane protein